MTEQKSTIVGGEAKRLTISDEIAAFVTQASDRIDRLDTDPIIRLALARVAVRSFAASITEAYPDYAAELASEFDLMAETIRTTNNLPDEIKLALTTEDEAAILAARGEFDAEDRESLGEVGGRGQGDPQGRDVGSPRRKGPRHNGPERIGKEHAVLRVGGA